MILFGESLFCGAIPLANQPRLRRGSSPEFAMFFFKKGSASSAPAAIESPAWLAPAEEGAAWRERSKTKPPLRLLPIAKIGLALSLIGLGAFSIASEQGFVASDNAVVSTRIISLRAPIEGVAADVDGGVGSFVTKGQLLVHISNPLFNDLHVVELRETLKRLQAEQKNAEADRASQLALAADLKEHAAIHAKANVQRLAGLEAEGQKALAALVSKQTQAQSDLDRGLPLAARGIISKAGAERLQTALQAAQHHVEAQKGRLESLRAESDAANSGVLSSPGGIDVSYSAQRGDQVAIEIAHLTRAIADLGTEAEAIKARLDSEERFAALARSADLMAPVGGMIWRLGASNAERLGAGDIAAELVDCNSPTLLVAIPQDRFSDIKIGGLARYRLSGELNDRTGAVLSVAGQGNLSHAEHYAALPVAEAASTIIAQVAMNGAAKPPVGHPDSDLGGDHDRCLIGRTARVLLPTTGGGLLDRISRRIF
jgi:multidrug efflux pump subunit AcrA (membrane-fusion protein)